MATRKDQKKAEEARISSVGDFKQRISGIQELPSGLTVRVFNPGGMALFLKNGTIPNSLIPIVKAALASGKQPDPEEFLGKDGEVDPEMLAEMFTMMDDIALQTIVAPPIAPAPTQADVEKWNADPEHADEQVTSPHELRNNEQLYIDEVPMDDKQFLMQWVMGGTRDLETFRLKSQSGVDAVVEKQSAVRAAQSAAGLDVG